MNNNNQNNNNNTRGRPFSHSFNIGTTLQNVFRNINHAFASNHNSSSGRRRDDQSRDYRNDIPPLEPLNAVGGPHDSRPTDTIPPFPSSIAPNPSTSSAPPPIDVGVPPRSQIDSQLDEDEDSMPDLRSVTDSSDEEDAGVATFNPVPPHQDVEPGGGDRDNVRMDDDGGPPPLEPITGTRRARVDDDGDDARDRRHPSERVGSLPPGDAAPQNANPQQPPRPPPGLFGALFGFGPPPPGLNFLGGEPLHEHAQTGEDTTDPSPIANNATPGHAPRGVPILTAGFTLTIPLFGPPPANRPGPAVPGGQGGPGGAQGPDPAAREEFFTAFQNPPGPAAPDGQGGQGGPGGAHGGLFGMDPATREEFFAAFAAFFQEFQALDEAREDPERAKKLLAGLQVVPLGLVKRLERVGGAPGGHVGDSSAEGTSSGCAICWDTLLDCESDNFSGQQFSGGEAPQSSSSGTGTAEGQNEAHTESDVMDVDAPSESASHSEAGTSAPAPPSSEEVKIISLPCAHVFHASCLLPWFTRAKQATCPTCRFNIDPENLTYTPLPRPAFNHPPPAQPNNVVPNSAPAGPQAVPEVPSEAPASGTRAVDAAAAPVDPARATTDTHPVPPPPTGQAGVPPAGPGFGPFPIPGVPIFSFPAFQIPLRPPGAQAQEPGGGNQGIDIMTIGLDMFVGGLPPEGRDDDTRDNIEGGNGAANPNGLGQDLHSLIEGLLRTTRNIIPQVINAQGPAPAPAPAAPDAAPADGAQPQPQVGSAPEAAGPQPAPPFGGGPRGVPPFPFRPMMFRPARPMPPPRRERKTWALPPAPGPSLRQRVEQREREQGLRCSDTSCGIGPSDEDPYLEPSASSTKQVSIHPLPGAGDHESNHGPVCAHAFHPACLVSAERVAGWGGEDKREPLVEVSCPVCRAVGCVTSEEWELGVSAL